MDVIRHDHRDVELVPVTVVMSAVVQYTFANRIGQGLPLPRRERDELRRRWRLQVWQIAAI
jgi:hypothetical protein